MTCYQGEADSIQPCDTAECYLLTVDTSKGIRIQYVYVGSIRCLNKCQTVYNGTKHSVWPRLRMCRSCSNVNPALKYVLCQKIWHVAPSRIQTGAAALDGPLSYPRYHCRTGNTLARHGLNKSISVVLQPPILVQFWRSH